MNQGQKENSPEQSPGGSASQEADNFFRHPTNGKNLVLDFDLGEWLPESEKGFMYSFLHKLTEEQRKFTENALRRADIYLPLILPCLEEHGLPKELAALPFIESAFAEHALSSTGAAGLWQLMPETARRFGLLVNEETDERYDVLKSTAATARFLHYLYQRFESWPLALAAYNGGEGNVNRALRLSKTDCLQELTRHCRSGFGKSLLSEETLQFVPRFTAALLIMSNSRELDLAGHDVLNLGSGREKTTRNNLWNPEF